MSDEDLYCNPQQNVFLQNIQQKKKPSNKPKPSLFPKRKVTPPKPKPQHSTADELKKRKVTPPKHNQQQSTADELNNLFKNRTPLPSAMRSTNKPIIAPKPRTYREESQNEISKIILRSVPSPLKTEINSDQCTKQDVLPECVPNAASDSGSNYDPTSPPPVPIRTSTLSNNSLSKSLSQDDEVSPHHLSRKDAFSFTERKLFSSTPSIQQEISKNGCHPSSVSVEYPQIDDINSVHSNISTEVNTEIIVKYSLEILKGDKSVPFKRNPLKPLSKPPPIPVQSFPFHLVAETDELYIDTALPDPIDVSPDPSDPISVSPGLPDPKAVIPDPSDPISVIPDPSDPISVSPPDPIAVIPDPPDPIASNTTEDGEFDEMYLENVVDIPPTPPNSEDPVVIDDIPSLRGVPEIPNYAPPTVPLSVTTCPPPVLDVLPEIQLEPIDLICGDLEADELYTDELVEYPHFKGPVIATYNTSAKPPMPSKYNVDLEGEEEEIYEDADFPDTMETMICKPELNTDEDIYEAFDNVPIKASSHSMGENKCPLAEQRCVSPRLQPSYLSEPPPVTALPLLEPPSVVHLPPPPKLSVPPPAASPKKKSLFGNIFKSKTKRSSHKSNGSVPEKIGEKKDNSDSITTSSNVSLELDQSYNDIQGVHDLIAPVDDDAVDDEFEDPDSIYEM